MKVTEEQVDEVKRRYRGGYTGFRGRDGRLGSAFVTRPKGGADERPSFRRTTSRFERPT